MQACCMRILLLAPIYAIVSWLMMVFLPISTYIEIIRDTYEAYALYCFWVMLVLWCAGQRRVVEIIAKEGTLSCYLCPLLQGCGCGVSLYRWPTSIALFRYAVCVGSQCGCCSIHGRSCCSSGVNSELFRVVKRDAGVGERSASDPAACRYLRVSIMQLMVVKPLSAFLCAIIATSSAPNKHRIRQLRILVLISTSVAMHSIFTLFTATRPYMRGLNASRKFLVIKAVVAAILLQQFAINAALSMDLIPEGDYGYTAEDKAKRIYCTVIIMQVWLRHHMPCQQTAELHFRRVCVGPSGDMMQRECPRHLSHVVGVQMALFSLLLSYAFSHHSMSIRDAGRAGGGLPSAMSALPLDAGLAGASGAKVSTSVFELVIGDTTASRKLVEHLPPHPEAVSLLPVLAFWDVLLMGRVEEGMTHAAGPGLPVELDEADSLVNSSRDLDLSPSHAHVTRTGERPNGPSNPTTDPKLVWTRDAGASNRAASRLQHSADV
jgi:hypothetical protein